MDGIPNLADLNKIMAGCAVSQESSEDEEDLEQELQLILAGKEPSGRMKSKSDLSKIKKPSLPSIAPRKNSAANLPSSFIPETFDDSDIDEDDPVLNAELSNIIGSVASGIASKPSRPAPSKPDIPTQSNHPISNLIDFKGEGQAKKRQPSSDNSEEIVPPSRSGQSKFIIPQPDYEIKPEKSSTDNRIDEAKLLNLLNEFKKEALKAKKENDIDSALRHMREAKNIHALISQLREGIPLSPEDIPSFPIKDLSSGKQKVENTQSGDKKTNFLDTSALGSMPISSEAISESKKPASLLEELQKRLKKWREVEKESAQSGNESKAKRIGRVCKSYENAIKACKGGQPYEYEFLAHPPGFPDLPSNSNNANKPEMSKDAQVSIESTPSPNTISRPGPHLRKKSDSLIDELEKRLVKWKQVEQEAKGQGNETKAQRMGRVCKSYENAIKACRAGKPYDYENLAVPVGFLDLPTGNTASQQGSAEPTTAKRLRPDNQRQDSSDTLSGTATKSSSELSNAGSTDLKPASTKPQAPTPPVRRLMSIKQKELDYLSERQRLFKEAALNSKRNGDIRQATEYLRMAKGFDPLIEAAKNNQPINTANIPTPPQLSDDFVVVHHEEIPENHDPSEDDEIFRKLEVDLQKQTEMCKKNKEHFLALGDVSSSSKFEKYALDTLKDLDMLRNFWQKKDPVPRFKYETRSFSIVVCNTDVSTNELHVEVVRCIELPVKHNVDSYVKIEFPFPPDVNQTARTRTIKDTLSPVFQETFKFNIDRKTRALARIIKRHSLKCEIFSKGGLFRADSLIGIVQVKLADLENKCTIHNSFSLTEGRKTIGGSLEVRVKIREPLLTKQVEEIEYKWLSFF